MLPKGNLNLITHQREKTSRIFFDDDCDLKEI